MHCPCSPFTTTLAFVLFCLLWGLTVLTTKEPWLGMRMWGGVEGYQSGVLECQNQSLKDTWRAQGECGEEQLGREQMPRGGDEENYCNLSGSGEPPSGVPWLERRGWDGTSVLGLESFLGPLFLVGMAWVSSQSILVFSMPGTEIRVLYAFIH